MATSLETRAPFLDVDVMELAFSMPGHLKIRDGQRKWVLKRAMRGLLPDGILHRKKQGFSIPLKHWLRRRAAAADASSCCRPSGWRAAGLFAPAVVQAAHRRACRRAPRITRTRCFC
jgi:asparagine synthetase B (glutamine-hydrolysing)